MIEVARLLVPFNYRIQIHYYQREWSGGHNERTSLSRRQVHSAVEIQ